MDQQEDWHPETTLSIAVIGADDAATALWADRLREATSGAQKLADEMAPGTFRRTAGEIHFAPAAFDDPSLLSHDLVVLADGAPELWDALIAAPHGGPAVLFFAVQGAAAAARWRELGRGDIVPGIDGRPLDARSLAEAALAPPDAPGERDMLHAFLGDRAQHDRLRPEYEIVTRLLGASRRGRRPDAPNPGQPAAGWIEPLRAAYAHADGLAVHYGERWRSTMVARSMLLLFSTLITGILGLAFPDIAFLTVPIQILVTVLAFWDRRRAARGHWQRKWLEYRSAAERLRCLRFLHQAGVPLRAALAPGRLGWTEWYALRIERALGEPPERDATALLQQLAEVEIAGQITYHSRAREHFSRLDRHLRWLAFGIGIGTAVLALLTLMFGAAEAGISGVPWSVLVTLGLTIAPAILAALNGFRIEFDLVRQAERSARTASGLSDLLERLKTAPPSPLLMRAAHARAASLMMDEVSTWHSTARARAG